jgi:CheY-like chemotaxis protein
MILVNGATRSPDAGRGLQAFSPTPAFAMTHRVRVLLVEDNPDDAELMLRELRKAGFDPEWWRVETRDEFAAQLEARPDVIPSDHRLPEFDSVGALDVLIEHELDIPLIIVSSAIGEEAAMAALQRGAADREWQAGCDRRRPSLEGLYRTSALAWIRRGRMALSKPTAPEQSRGKCRSGRRGASSQRAAAELTATRAVRAA